MEEIWKVYKIKEWTSIAFGKTKVTRQTIWEISNLGNIKKNGKLVYPNPNRDYLKIGDFNIHRAVAELFIPNQENKPCVDHINTNTHDNRACNLRWCTHKENMNNKLSRCHMRMAKSYTSEETRKKMSESGKGHRNYVEGYHWIHLQNKEKRVSEEYLNYWLDDGWIYGRVKNKK